MGLNFKIILNEDLCDEHRSVFGDLLKRQNRVQGDLYQKADRCKLICIVSDGLEPIGIGGIKRATLSDFDPQKANLPNVRAHFNWELGYIYVRDKFSGQGVASKIVDLLLDSYGPYKLMASTEYKATPAMAKILKKNGFEEKGNSWKSQITNNELKLFLRE